MDDDSGKSNGQWTTRKSDEDRQNMYESNLYSHTMCATCNGTCSNMQKQSRLINPKGSQFVNGKCFSNAKYKIDSPFAPLLHMQTNDKTVDIECTETTACDVVSNLHQWKCVYTCIAITFLLSVIIGLFISAMIVDLSRKCNELDKRLHSINLESPKQYQHICLPCDTITQGPFDEDNLELNRLYQYTENDTNVCCATNFIQTSLLLNLVTKRRQMQTAIEDKLKQENRIDNHEATLVPSNKTTFQASALLQAGPQNGSDNNISEQPIRNWETTQPGTHVLGINIINDRLIVPQTGIYFLYSQVAFLLRPNFNVDVGTQNPSLQHKVYRFNPKYALGKQELLRSAKTVFWEQGQEYGRYTSYLGASLQLNVEDQLYVTVSRLQDLSRDSTNTYFGLIKVL